MKKVTTSIIAMILCLVMIVLPACSAAEQASSTPENSDLTDSSTANNTPVKISFWNLWDGPDGAYAQEMIEKFNSETGIEVEMSVYSSSQYYTKLKTAALANSGPDVAVSHVSGYIPEFKNDGIIMSLTQACKDYGVEINFDDYVSDVASAAKVDGEQYALPVDSIARLIYYNKSLLQGTPLLNADGKLALEPGFDNFKAFLDKVKEEVPDALAPMAFSPQAPQFVLNWLAFYSQKSTVPFFENNSVTFDEATAAQVLSDYADIYNNYCPPNLSGNAHLDLFNNGQIPILIDGTFNMSGCEKAIGSENLGVSYFPQWYDRPSVVSGSHSLMLMKKSDRADGVTKGALQFIKWFGDNDWMWAKSGALPANKTTYAQEEFTSLPGRMDLMLATTNSLPLPMLPVGMIHSTSEVNVPIEKAMRKEMSAQDAIATVKASCQKIFDDNK